MFNLVALLLADGGISLVLAIIAIVSSVAMMVLASSPQDGAEGSKMGYRENRAQPGDPSPWVAGAPRWSPSILARDVSLFNVATGAASMDSFNGSLVRPRTSLILDTGIGEMDGGDLGVWLDDQPVFAAINPTTDPLNRRVHPISLTAKRRFVFPKKNVEQEGCLFYTVSGGVETLFGAGRGTNMSKYPKTVYGTKATPDLYDYTDFDPSLVKTQYLFTEIDERWDVDNMEFEVTLKKSHAYLGTIGASRTVTLKRGSGWDIRKVLVGQTGFKWNPTKTYADMIVFDDSVTGNRFYFRDGFKSVWQHAEVITAVTAKTFTHGLNLFDIETDELTLESRAVFLVDVPTSDRYVCDYRIEPFGDEANIDVEFIKGRLHQGPVRTGTLGGTSQTFVRNAPVAFGAITSYTSSVPVQNMRILLSSGSGGFHWIGKSGLKVYDVTLQIRVRQVGAPDTGAPQTGPNSASPQHGWVKLVYGGTEDLRIYANVQGGFARWQFDVANGIDNAYRKNTKLSKTLFPNQGRLKVEAEYEIEITRYTAVPANADGQRETFLEAVTEQTFRQYMFPNRSFLLLDYDEGGGLKREPSSVDVQFRGKLCRVVTGFDVFGGPIFDVRWTRNPVWNAVELATNTVTGGGVGGHAALINWQSAKAAADFCDQQVTWAGETGTRSEVDLALPTQQALFAAQSDLLSGSGVAPAFSHGKWHYPFDDDTQTPVVDPLTGLDWTINDDDILDKEGNRNVTGVTFDFKSLESTATDIHVTFPDEDNAFDSDADPVYYPVADDSITIRNVRKIDLPGVRRRWQAEMVAEKAAREEVLNTRFASVRMNNLRTHALEPNDVIILDIPSADLPPTKARIVEREPGGANNRIAAKFGLLGKAVASVAVGEGVPAVTPITTSTSSKGSLGAGGAIWFDRSYNRNLNNRRKQSSRIMKVEEL